LFTQKLKRAVSAYFQYNLFNAICFGFGCVGIRIIIHFCRLHAAVFFHHGAARAPVVRCVWMRYNGVGGGILCHGAFGYILVISSNGHGKRIADIGSRSCAPVRCCRKVAVHLQALQVAGHPGTGQVGRVCNVFVFFAGCHKKGKRQGSKQYHFFHNLFCLVLKRKEMQQQTGRQCAAK
jgi:hypothetical protein